MSHDSSSPSSGIPTSRPTRRQFARSIAGSAVGVFAAPAILRGRNLNERLRIAAIGVGGRGYSNLHEVASEDIVALCDVAEPAVERAASLPRHHLVCTQGIPTTSAARTLIDIARMSGLDAAVVSMDCALRLGLTTVEDLCLVADDCHTWPGGRRPMLAIRSADGLSESPLESVSRLAFVRMHLPEPELQVPFFDAAGLIGRVDFYWKAHRTVGEADGRMKYDQARALWDEKRREDRLRELGLQVVRWSHGDITQNPTVVYDRLIAAFRRGDRP